MYHCSQWKHGLTTLFTAHKCHASGACVRLLLQLWPRAAAALCQVQVCGACTFQASASGTVLLLASQACTPLPDEGLPQPTLGKAAAEVLLRAWRMSGSWMLAATSRISILQRCAYPCRSLPVSKFSSMHISLVTGLLPEHLHLSSIL